MAARKHLKHDDETKDKIRGSQLLNLLTQHALTGKYNDSPVDANRIAAAKAALPFLKPALQSIEQTTHQASEEMSPEARLSMVSALISSHPELISQLNLAPKPLEVSGSGVESPQQDAQKASK